MLFLAIDTWNNLTYNFYKLDIHAMIGNSKFN